LTVHLSPYEEMQDLRYTTEKLSCNAGLTHYVISNNGDVHPCLSWFRFTDRDKRKMGNIFDGSFKKFPDRQECNLFCEMEHVVDQSNSMVKDLATKKCESS
jgi:radical SAM protein with 4Fe4S-binding SPASM domain